jgi:biopolymer transport protein ExbD
MSSFEFDRRRKADAQLNIAPLIDIVFLLLIFFVLSSHFVTEKGFNIKLPKAVHASSQNSKKLTVYIDETHTVYIEDRQIALDSLAGELKKELFANDEKTVVIKADEGADIGFAVNVMDIARGANAEGLVISTRVLDNEKN